MRTIRVLLGNCEGLLNDYIQALLAELYGDRAAVVCTRTAWLEDFRERAARSRFDLLMFIPRNLRCEDGQSPVLSGHCDALDLMRSAKVRRPTPVVAFTPADQRGHDEPLFTKAGVDAVLGLPFEAEALKATVARLLRVRTVRQQTSNPRRQGYWPSLATVSQPMLCS